MFHYAENPTRPVRRKEREMEQLSTTTGAKKSRRPRSLRVAQHVQVIGAGVVGEISHREQTVADLPAPGTYGPDARDPGPELMEQSG